MDIWLH